MLNRPTMSVSFHDPEAEPVPEPELPETIQEVPKRRGGRPPGSKNKPKAKKRSIPWFNIWRAAFWAVAALVSLVALYNGIQGWLGQSAAYVALAASVPPVAWRLDESWKRMRS